MVDSPTEAELLLENLQATNAELVRDLEDARKEIEDSILKREELISHYETLLQDKQVTLADLEHQLGKAKARVYDLDTDLMAARYAIHKAEDALEQQAGRQEFTQSDNPALKVPTQLVKSEAEELSIPWDALRDILEFLPPTSNLEHAYVLDRQVLITPFRLTYREKVDPMRFEAIWQQAYVQELENLFAEIVLRADLELTDKAAAYIRIGDFGLRRLLYYTKLKIQLEQRREAANNSFKGIVPHLIGPRMI